MNLICDDVGRTKLTYAILLHRTKEALRLLKKCSDVNYKDKRGYSYLDYAAQKGEIEVMRKLLERGANPNTDDRAIVSALAVAQNYVEGSYDCAFEMVKLLLEAGADPDICPDGDNSHGRRTARQLAKYLASGPINDYIQAWPISDKQDKGQEP